MTARQAVPQASTAMQPTLLLNLCSAVILSHHDRQQESRDNALMTGPLTWNWMPLQSSTDAASQKSAISAFVPCTSMSWFNTSRAKRIPVTGSSSGGLVSRGYSMRTRHSADSGETFSARGSTSRAQTRATCSACNQAWKHLFGNAHRHRSFADCSGLTSC